MNTLKKIILTTPHLQHVFEHLNKIRLTGTFSVSLLTQKEKAALIINYAKKYNCTVFVETGTYKGETVNACKDFFEDLTSIELSHELFMESKERFASTPKIHIMEGNSGDILPQVVKMDKPTLFWLDAHYSGGETAQGPEDSPIMKELNFILNKNTNHCILIDDARCFNGKSGYPTISALKKMITERNKEKKENLVVEVKNDIIRIVKKI